MRQKEHAKELDIEYEKKKKTLSDSFSFAKHSHTQLKGSTELHHLSTANHEQFISWIKISISIKWVIGGNPREHFVKALFYFVKKKVQFTFHKLKD